VEVCDVTFVLENFTHSPVEVNYVIRAHDLVSLAGSGQRNEIVGEINDTIVLGPTEAKRLERRIEVLRKPDRVVVSIWTST